MEIGRARSSSSVNGKPHGVPPLSHFGSASVPPPAHSRFLSSQNLVGNGNTDSASRERAPPPRRATAPKQQRSPTYTPREGRRGNGFRSKDGDSSASEIYTVPGPPSSLVSSTVPDVSSNTHAAGTNNSQECRRWDRQSKPELEVATLQQESQMGRGVRPWRPTKSPSPSSPLTTIVQLEMPSGFPPSPSFEKSGNAKAGRRVQIGSESRRSSSSSNAPHGSLTHQSPMSDSRSSRMEQRPPLKVQLSEQALLGKGSSGKVYRAMDRNSNRLIAVKEIPINKESSSSSNAAASSVNEELMLLKQLEHPNIVRFLGEETDTASGCLRIYMDFVSGGSIRSLLRDYGKLHESQAASFTQQMLEGLVYLHSRNIVHRDLKGDNLLVEPSGVLKLADFGTAGVVSALSTREIGGTAYFMSPEVLTKESAVTEKTDIWSVGCCVLEMLVGKPPLANLQGQYAIMMMIGESKGELLRDYMPKESASWSADVRDFLKQCLRRNPEQRPSAAQLREHPWITKNAVRPVLELPYISNPPQESSNLPDRKTHESLTRHQSRSHLSEPSHTMLLTRSSSKNYVRRDRHQLSPRALRGGEEEGGDWSPIRHNASQKLSNKTHALSSRVAEERHRLLPRNEEEDDEELDYTYPMRGNEGRLQRLPAPRATRPTHFDEGGGECRHYHSGVNNNNSIKYNSDSDSDSDSEEDERQGPPSRSPRDSPGEGENAENHLVFPRWTDGSGHARGGNRSLNNRTAYGSTGLPLLPSPRPRNRSKVSMHLR